MFDRYWWFHDNDKETSKRTGLVYDSFTDDISKYCMRKPTRVLPMEKSKSSTWSNERSKRKCCNRYNVWKIWYRLVASSGRIIIGTNTYSLLRMGQDK